MSQTICNSKSQPYWTKSDWQPTHMTWEWLASELRSYNTGRIGSRLPRAVVRFNSRRRASAKQSRRQNRQARRAGRGHR